MNIARIALSAATFAIDRPYSYAIPTEMREKLLPGMRVLVPFGTGNRASEGIVLSLAEEEKTGKLKQIRTILDETPVLSREGLRLALWMRERYFCTVYSAAMTMLPTGLWYVLKQGYALKPGVDREEAYEKTASSPKTRRVLEILYANGGQIDTEQLKSLPELKDPAGILRELEKVGIVEKQVQARRKVGDKTEKVARLAMAPAEALALTERKRKSAPMRYAVTELLCNLGSASVKELCYFTGASMQTVKSLAKSGVLTLEEQEVFRRELTQPDEILPLHTLNREQQGACDGLRNLLHTGTPQAALLYGVTGSGKTQVYLHLIQTVLEQGRGAIVMVPEIALTPQTVGIFVGCYGDRVAVIHSGLSAGERFDAYRRIKDGLADVVIGTRSAVFAPLPRLGMIVIDEEQEHTYKSDTNPKYAAHDVARFRAAEHGALMLLASATPSLGSYYKAKTGVYTLVQLRERYGGAKLPEVRVADMREEIRSGNLSPVGETLAQSLRETVGGGRQAIVFLNRRGYNSFITCRACGENVRCPNCSVSLTYHTRRAIDDGDEEGYLRRRMASGILACHYCGYRTRVPATCPSCGSDHFAFMGYGTQRVEEELNGILPEKRVVRMDMDTTSGKFAHEAILSGFRSGETDVLVGTQMVTKGHDFPRVTLVGVLNADSSLYLDDFRASERTFAMLTQVVGRAGRGSDPGVAVVQTMNPGSEVIALAAKQDYEAFYEREIRIRRALTFPPFCDIAVVTLSSADETLVGQSSVRLSAWIREALRTKYADVQTVVFGPFEAPVYKVQNKCRMRLVVKCKLNRKSRAMFADLLTEFGRSGGKRLTVSVDFNPSSV